MVLLIHHDDCKIHTVPIFYCSLVKDAAFGDCMESLGWGTEQWRCKNHTESQFYID